MKLDAIKKYLPAGALGFSLILHVVIFICIGGVVLIQAIPPKSFFTADAGPQSADLPPPPDTPEDFEPEPATGDPAPAEDSPPAFAAVPIEQITANTVTTSAFALPPQVGISTGSAEGKGAGGVPGGTGTGRGGPPRSLANPFGERNLSGAGVMVGTMYDLKQTADGKPSKMVADGEASNNEYLEFVKKFVTGGWNPGNLAPFYKVEQPIGNYQIFIPARKAGDAPAAFGAEKYVQPKRWLIHYTGSFTAPAGGAYRFVGMGDDVLIVRLDRRTVLNGSLILNLSPSGKREHLGPPYAGANPIYKMYTGDWFTLQAGQTYPLDILIGECPGGNFAAYLLIQQKDVDYGAGQNGLSPALPVFQTQPVAIPQGSAPAVTKEPFVVQ